MTRAQALRLLRHHLTQELGAHQSWKMSAFSPQQLYPASLQTFSPSFFTPTSGPTSSSDPVSTQTRRTMA
eukprot:CAMPEP_0170594158 /NCGR_PEP_ID=MMETSP0224-20130122/13848_1 /TAXON_ID=285029 /ORGANISM="Togula jolla, Strain CCCM 725" /LENGTH=69 /DNA_ID=CAMNT_0010918191 /DNA_START=28 /DNA_END=237 /DNA_ORIENTATION=+